MQHTEATGVLSHQAMPFDIQSFKKELQPGALKERAKNLNDRYTSPSSAQTGYTPAGARAAAAKKAPPPLPPSTARRTDGPTSYTAPPSRSHPQPPSLPQRDSSFEAVHETDTSYTSSDRPIQWTNLPPQDKEQFFSLLDGVRPAYSDSAWIHATVLTCIVFPSL